MPSRKSLRFQLPLTYAAIALVAALALGAVLLITLRGYYQAQERTYLQENAHAISVVVSEMIASELPHDLIEAQIKSFSLLTLARIQVLDQDGNQLADSGVPDVFQITSFSGGGGPPQILVGARAIGNDELARPVTDMVIIHSDAPPPEGFPIPFEQSLSMYPPPLRGEDEPGGEGSLSVVSFAAPAVGTLYGYNFSIELNEPGEDVQRRAIERAVERSEEHVTVPLINPDGGIIGQLQLSDGPAYGQEIVNSVARAWVVAGLLALFLAAGVGILISRQMAAPVLALTTVTSRMAEGDLTARASVSAPEELSTLGHSFNEMAERIEEMVSTLRNFVSDAAHELNTPLTALRTDLEIVSRKLVSDQSGQHYTSLVDRALTQADRLQALVDNLLSLSRIESQEYPHTQVNLSMLLKEIGEIYASRAEQAGIVFDLEVSAPEAQTLGNEMQLRSAIGNLIENAIKFTPEGGKIQLGLEEIGSGWQVWVKDTGVGIPPDEIPHLFQRFHRARNVSEYPGNGLGLAIVKAIVDAHNGRVSIENHPVGTQLIFWIPKE